jgi:ParB-like chromosome segregation protein Spo0J
MGNLSFEGLAIIQQIGNITARLSMLLEDERIEVINQIKLALHEVSPMKDEPVDCVLWVKSDLVQSNDYNPNVVAPPEMKLLERSIDADGFTQPIVTYPINGHREVVDGFHRNRIGKESKIISKRVLGYLPVTTIRADRQDREDRIASTIRHNRARGRHQVDNMSEIVVELSRRNWSEEKIGRELGMEPDEVLRLKQISGLAEMFADHEFSEAWEIQW